jgi:mannose-6-phosphate isomerase
MPAIRLSTHCVEKPWGRHTLWPGFADPDTGEEPVGEIWFDVPPGVDASLMVKYLFTSERLSVQVHPNDSQARAAGYPHGKDEAWIVLAAEPDATIALGTLTPMSRSALRRASIDGRIEHLLDWKPVRAGDVIYSPAGTVHAIGSGLTVIEIQQNLDLTYRLYDYGRPRELHLDAGVAVSNPVPFVSAAAPAPRGPGREALVEQPKFSVERWHWAGERMVEIGAGERAWFVPVAGSGWVNGSAWRAGQCWLLEGAVALTLSAGSDVLLAYPGMRLDTVHFS